MSRVVWKRKQMHKITLKHFLRAKTDYFLWLVKEEMAAKTTRILADERRVEELRQKV